MVTVVKLEERVSKKLKEFVGLPGLQGVALLDSCAPERQPALCLNPRLCFRSGDPEE